MKRILLIFLIVCALAGGGFWYWTTTPQYSMQKLAQSVREHDVTNFHLYFNPEGVASKAVDDLLADRIRDDGGSGLLERFLGIAVLGIFKPELVSMLSRNIDSYVAKVPESSTNAQNESEPGQAPVDMPSRDDQNPPQSPFQSPNQALPAESEPTIRQHIGRFFNHVKSTLKKALKPPSLKEVLVELGITKENYRGLTPFEVNADVCHVGLKFQPPGKEELVVELELQKTENHWRVERFSNLASLSKTLSRNSEQDEAIGE